MSLSRSSYLERFLHCDEAVRALLAHADDCSLGRIAQTCRRLQKALDFLWECLSSLHPIVGLVPSVDYELIANDTWTHIATSTKRIRRLMLSQRSDGKAHFLKILEHIERQSLPLAFRWRFLASLATFEITIENAEDAALLTYFSRLESLRRLGITLSSSYICHTPRPDLQIFLSPSLRSLTLHHDPPPIHSSYATEVYDLLFCQLKSALYQSNVSGKLKIERMSISQSLFSAFVHEEHNRNPSFVMSSLTSLRLSGPAISTLTDYNGADISPHLLKVELEYALFPNCLVGFGKSIRYIRIDNVCNDPSDWNAFSTFLLYVSRNCPLLEGLDIREFRLSSDSAPENTLRNILVPLAQCVHLVYLRLGRGNRPSGDYWDFSYSIRTDMLKSWPNLETLGVASGGSDMTRRPDLKLDAIILFKTMWPRLRQLTITLDASTIPRVPAQSECSGLSTMSIGFGLSWIKNPHAVADWLFQSWPTLRIVASSAFGNAGDPRYSWLRRWHQVKQVLEAHRIGMPHSSSNTEPEDVNVAQSLGLPPIFVSGGDRPTANPRNDQSRRSSIEPSTMTTPLADPPAAERPHSAPQSSFLPISRGVTSTQTSGGKSKIRITQPSDIRILPQDNNRIIPSPRAPRSQPLSPVSPVTPTRPRSSPKLLNGGHAELPPTTVANARSTPNGFAGIPIPPSPTSPVATVMPKDLFASLVSHLSSSQAEFSVPLKELCDHLTAYTLSHSSYVRKIIRRKHKRGLKHEFLIVEADVLDERGVCFRLERAAARNSGTRSLWSLSSIFPSDDTARVALTSKRLIAGEESDVKTEASFLPGRVTLSILNSLLCSFIEVSEMYNLMGENCYFFCSVVLQLLCEKFPHEIDGKYGHESLGLDSREAIRARFLARMSH